VPHRLRRLCLPRPTNGVGIAPVGIAPVGITTVGIAPVGIMPWNPAGEGEATAGERDTRRQRL
jgi:hypothetical protein